MLRAGGPTPLSHKKTAHHHKFFIQKNAQTAHPGSFFYEAIQTSRLQENRRQITDHRKLFLLVGNSAQPFALVFCFHANAFAPAYITTLDPG